MSLVKIRSPYINDATTTLSTPFSVRFQRELEISPNSTVELINFGCRLDRVPYVSPIAPMNIEIYDLNTATSLGNLNILALPSSVPATFFTTIENTLNMIDPNIEWIISLNPGVLNATVRIQWTSINGITQYDLRVIFSQNYTIMGFPTSSVRDDTPGNKLNGIISAPNPMILLYYFPKNLTIEILNFPMNSFDSVSHQKESIAFFIPAVDFDIGDGNPYPLIKYQPSNTIRIKLNNEFPIKTNELTVRIMTDTEINNPPALPYISKIYAGIKTFCALTLSFKSPTDL